MTESTQLERVGEYGGRLMKSAGLAALIVIALTVQPEEAEADTGRPAPQGYYELGVCSLVSSAVTVVRLKTGKATKIKKNRTAGDDDPPCSMTIHALGGRHVSARLGVMFGRQPRARGMNVGSIADDAVLMASCGAAARRAMERQQSPDAHFAAAREVAERYGAAVVELRDLDGAVLCLKFREGIFSSGFRNLFYVA